MKTFTSTFGIVMAAVIMLHASRTFATDTNGLPPVADPVSLRIYCISLYHQFPFAEDKANQVPTNAWPTSVQSLHPFKVTEDKYGVYIWILHDSHAPKQDVGSRGYFIQVNLNLSPPRVAHGGGGRFDLYHSDYDGIDIFHLPWAVL